LKKSASKEASLVLNQQATVEPSNNACRVEEDIAVKCTPPCDSLETSSICPFAGVQAVEPDGIGGKSALDGLEAAGG
jgi:hypothetical protein